MTFFSPQLPSRLHAIATICQLVICCERYFIHASFTTFTVKSAEFIYKIAGHAFSLVYGSLSVRCAVNEISFNARMLF